MVGICAKGGGPAQSGLVLCATANSPSDVMIFHFPTLRLLHSTLNQSLRMKFSLLKYSKLRGRQPGFSGAARRLSRPVFTDSTTAKGPSDASDNIVKETEAARAKESKKTMAQIDEELRMKLEGRSGDGGAAGLELENGQPVAM
jgi:hypothetical protein